MCGAFPWASLYQKCRGHSECELSLFFLCGIHLLWVQYSSRFSHPFLSVQDMILKYRFGWPYSLGFQIRQFCGLEVDESLFVASQILSIRDFVTTKLNKINYLLFELKFNSVGLLNLKNHCTWVSKQTLTHCNANLRRNIIQYYYIWEPDTDCLDLQLQ